MPSIRCCYLLALCVNLLCGQPCKADTETVSGEMIWVQLRDYVVTDKLSDFVNVEAIQESLKAFEADPKLQELPEKEAAIEAMRSVIHHFIERLEKGYRELEDQSQVKLGRLIDEKLSAAERERLYAFINTDYGKHRFTEEHPHEGEEKAHAQYSEKERMLYQGLKDEGVMERFSELVDEGATWTEMRRNQWLKEEQQLANAESGRSLAAVFDPQNLFYEEWSEDDEGLSIFLDPIPSVSRYLDAKGIKSGLAGGKRGSDSAREGVVVLLSYGKGVLERQWLVVLEADRKMSATKEGDVGKVDQVVRYTSLGYKHEYVSGKERIDVEVIGPFAVSKPNLPVDKVKSAPSEVWARTEFLRIGMLEFSKYRAMLGGQITEGGEFSPYAYEIGNEHVDTKKMDEAVSAIPDVRLSEAEDRKVAGNSLPFWEFLMISNNTKSLRGLLMEVAKLPGIAKMIRNGFSNSFSLVYGEIEGYYRFPEHLSPKEVPELYYYPITLKVYDEPSLYLRMVVGDAGGPLRLCSGVYAFVGASPDNPLERMAGRVIACW